eukprot:Phypoly_transcript_18910.p2 GENE.Phypoly_transcript_18910~~Phypoly_transcript_18910.p2  ORF type:complete len:104 (+),score=11.61 Phypoly_transcript_18910:402-713(+)
MRQNKQNKTKQKEKTITYIRLVVHNTNKKQTKHFDFGNISSPHVTGAMQSYGLLIYTGVCKCVLILLNSAQLTKVLLGSNSDVLSMLIRSLILISGRCGHVRE